MAPPVVSDSQIEEDDGFSPVSVAIFVQRLTEPLDGFFIITGAIAGPAECVDFVVTCGDPLSRQSKHAIRIARCDWIEPTQAHLPIIFLAMVFSDRRVQ